MTGPAADATGYRPQVSGLAATMTVVAMGLGYSITAADPTILSANISEVRAGLDMSSGTASFVASLATLTLAAAVLGAGALGATCTACGVGLRRIHYRGRRHHIDVADRGAGFGWAAGESVHLRHAGLTLERRHHPAGGRGRCSTSTAAPTPGSREPW